MTQEHIALAERLKRLGFSHNSQVKLYGQEFLVESGPIVLGGTLAFIDGFEKKSHLLRRVRIPLPILNVARGMHRAA